MTFSTFLRVAASTVGAIAEASAARYQDMKFRADVNKRQRSSKDATRHNEVERVNCLCAGPYEKHQKAMIEHVGRQSCAR